MVTVQKYWFAPSAEEAAEELARSRRNKIIGGGTWLKMGSASIGTAIDLSRLGLEGIERSGGEIRIGAMTTLRELETSPVLRERFGGAISASVKEIVGVQFRNTAVIGSGISMASGFSDPLCALLALDAELLWVRGGRMRLEEYLRLPKRPADVLTHILLRDEDARASWQCFRRTATDFSVLNLCLARKADGSVRLAVGARPMKAVRCPEAERLIERKEFAEAVRAVRELPFGSNLRGSADYRRRLAGVLLEDARQALREDEHDI